MCGVVFTSCGDDDDEFANMKFSYDFEVDGIYYDVVSVGEFTCEVVQNYYEGDITIPATVNYNNKTLTVVRIDNFAFNNNSQLTGITIPNTVTEIGYMALSGCNNLKRLKIEDGKTVLRLSKGNSDGHLSKSPISSLYIGRNMELEDIYYPPFYFNKTKCEAIIGDSVTEICGSLFDCHEGLTNVTIGNSVERIGSSAFSSCIGLTSIIIPNSVKEIGAYAFNRCIGLTSITIPNSVTKMEYYVFQNCSNLTDVKIGNSVMEIGSHVFLYCDALTNLYSLNTTPPKLFSDSFSDDQYMNLNVFVPKEALGAYQSADGWKNFWNLKGI